MVIKEYRKTILLATLILLLYVFTIMYGLDFIKNDYESAKKILSFLGIKRTYYMFFYYSIFSLAFFTYVLLKHSKHYVVRLMLAFYQTLLWGIYLRSDYDYLSIYKASIREYYKEIGYSVSPIIYQTNIGLISLLILSLVLFQIRNPFIQKIIHLCSIVFSIYMLFNFRWTLTAIFYDH